MFKEVTHEWGNAQRMKESFRLDFEALQHYVEELCGGKEFFLGCWSPDALPLEKSAPPSNIQMENGDNWFVIRNGADKVDGLLFPKTDASSDDTPQLTGFRGYIADEEIHTYSDQKRVRDYWAGDLNRRYNGIFSTFVISANGQSISFVTDIFGIGQLFYRKIGNLVFFSSSPALLSQEEDRRNAVSWSFRMLLGYIPGDCNLVDGVSNVPAASVMTFDSDGEKINRWYDYSNLARGDLPVDKDALKISRKYFEQSIDRCRLLEFGDVVLPLSSGYDSRRIFAQLENRKANFETVTVQMPTGSGEDLDGTLAPQIADDFNIKNTRFGIPSKVGWHEYDVRRIHAMDAQTDFHTWSVCLFDHFKDKKLTLYDGLGGDVLGFYGWNFKYNPGLLMPSGMFRAINDDVLPTGEKTNEKFKKLYQDQPEGINQDLISFCLWQSRKGTGIWSQQQAQPGQIILCPYFDLDYIENMLRFSVADGEKYLAQKEILKEFWPELYEYSGSGNIPENPEYIGDYSERIKLASLQSLIRKTLSSPDCRAQYRKFFKPIPRMLLHLAQHSLFITRRIHYWVKDIAEIVFWWQSRPVVIKFSNLRDNESGIENE